jgi:hypothetical protein
MIFKEEYIEELKKIGLFFIFGEDDREIEFIHKTIQEFIFTKNIFKKLEEGSMKEKLNIQNNNSKLFLLNLINEKNDSQVVDNFVNFIYFDEYIINEIIFENIKYKNIRNSEINDIINIYNDENKKLILNKNGKKYLEKEVFLFLNFENKLLYNDIKKEYLNDFKDYYTILRLLNNINNKFGDFFNFFNINSSDYVFYFFKFYLVRKFIL